MPGIEWTYSIPEPTQGTMVTRSIWPSLLHRKSTGLGWQMKQARTTMVNHTTMTDSMRKKGLVRLKNLIPHGYPGGFDGANIMACQDGGQHAVQSVQKLGIDKQIIQMDRAPKARANLGRGGHSSRSQVFLFTLPRGTRRSFLKIRNPFCFLNFFELLNKYEE